MILIGIKKYFFFVIKDYILIDLKLFFETVESLKK